MAVQKNRTSRSKRNMRRSHDALDKKTISIDSNSGELHLRHYITKNGFYRGKKIINFKEKNN